MLAEGQAAALIQIWHPSEAWGRASDEPKAEASKARSSYPEENCSAAAYRISYWGGGVLRLADWVGTGRC